MQGITDVYNKKLPEIQPQLASAKTTAESINIAVTFLNEVINEAAQADQGSTVSEQRLLATYFSPIIDSLRVVLRVEPSLVLPTEPEHSEAQAKPFGVNVGTAAGVLTAVGSAALIPHVVIGAAIGTAAGFMAASLVDKHATKQPKATIIEKQPSANKILKIPADAVLDCLRRAVEGFDGVQAELKAEIKVTEGKILSRPVDLEEFPNIIDFMQSLLEAKLNERELSKEFRTHLGLAERILRGYGIDTISYENRTSDDHFTLLQHSPDIEKPTTYRPALVKNGRVIAKGHFILPEITSD